MLILFAYEKTCQNLFLKILFTNINNYNYLQLAHLQMIQNYIKNAKLDLGEEEGFANSSLSKFQRYLEKFKLHFETYRN